MTSRYLVDRSTFGATVSCRLPIAGGFGGVVYVLDTIQILFDELCFVAPMLQQLVHGGSWWWLVPVGTSLAVVLVVLDLLGRRFRRLPAVSLVDRSVRRDRSSSAIRCRRIGLMCAE
jgi:hypothetical protein